VEARPRVVGTVIEFWSLFIAAVAYRIVMSHVINWYSVLIPVDRQ